MHAKQRQCELSSYQHSVMAIDVVLKKSTAFRAAPQMEMVRAKIAARLQLHDSAERPKEP